MRLTDEPKSLTDMKPDTIWPPAVQDVMKRALQRKSGDRYQKADDFGNALFMALERMPKNSAADMGTMILGAETALMSAPPPTRVDPNAAAAPMTRPSATVKPPVAPPTPARKSKTALYAGGGVVGLAAAVAAFVVISKSGGTPAVKHDSSTAAPQVAASVPVNPAANPGGGTPTQLPVSQGVQKTSPPPVVPKTTTSGTPAVDISARIPDLMRESQEDTSAARALSEAEKLQSRAIASSDVIGLSLVKANAHAMLGHDKQSCDIIDTIKERGASTVYAEKIAIMVKTCAR